MRMFRCLEMRGGWCFREKHVRGVANLLADDVSLWDRSTIAYNLRSLRPDIELAGAALWQGGGGFLHRHLGVEYVGGSVAGSTRRTYESGGRSWRTFRTLMGYQEYLESSD